MVKKIKYKWPVFTNFHQELVFTSAGSISKFSISVRSLENNMISILIDFWQLKLFQFRFESILSKITFSISVLSSSIFDFRALIFIAFLCDKFFRNFEKNLIFFIKIFLKTLYPQNSQIMDNFLGFEAIFEEFRAIFSTKMMYLYHFTNEIIESSINRDFQVQFRFN